MLLVRPMCFPHRFGPLISLTTSPTLQYPGPFHCCPSKIVRAECLVHPVTCLLCAFPGLALTTVLY